MRILPLLAALLVPAAAYGLEPPAVACTDADGTEYETPWEKDGLQFSWYRLTETQGIRYNFMLIDCQTRGILLSRFESATTSYVPMRWLFRRMEKADPFTLETLQPALRRRGIPFAVGRAADPLPCLCTLPRD